MPLGMASLADSPGGKKMPAPGARDPTKGLPGGERHMPELRREALENLSKALTLSSKPLAQVASLEILMRQGELL